jgi:AmmeMemoRadiSam system protein B
MEYPKIRPLEAFPVEVGGGRMYCLRDPQLYRDETLVVPEPTFFVISLLDGAHSTLDIQVEYMRRYGELLFQDQLKEIIQLLDDRLFLENDRFDKHRRKVEEEFLQSPVRKCILAGKAYEEEPEELISQLTSFFLAPEGPGELAEPIEEGQGPDRSLAGAVLPHIDYARGGPCYAWGFKEIAELSRARTFVVLGTLHGEGKGPYILTKKAYLTPLGVLHPDLDFITSLERECDYDPFSEEIAHRAEHSLELPLVFLSYMYRNRPPVRVVPILCASFHHFLEQGSSPLQDPLVSSFAKALKRALGDRGEEACLLASVDLAHMGPRFGGARPLGEGDRILIARQDRELIGFLERLDGEGFYREIQGERNRRNICGVSALYTLLSTVQARSGKLLHYGQWPDPQGTVTFATVAFYR